MATNKKVKVKVKPVKTIYGRSKPKKSAVSSISFSEKVETLVSFSNIYTTLNRKFPVGTLVVLNNYNYLSDSSAQTYRLAIILEVPKLFAKYKTYQAAYITEDGVLRTVDLEKNEIICRLEDAPLSFTFA